MAGRNPTSTPPEPSDQARRQGHTPSPGISHNSDATERRTQGYYKLARHGYTAFPTIQPGSKLGLRPDGKPSRLPEAKAPAFETIQDGETVYLGIGGWTQRDFGPWHWDQWGRYENMGCGIRTGVFRIKQHQQGGICLGIDIDFPVAAAAEATRQAFVARFGNTATRYGNQPKLLLLYQLDIAIHKGFWKYELPNDEQIIIELLNQGQMFVAFGTHPKTGKPYWWESGHPLNTPRWQLPMIKVAELEAFKTDVLDPLMIGFGYLPLPNKPLEPFVFGEPNTPRTVVPFRQPNQSVASPPSLDYNTPRNIYEAMTHIKRQKPALAGYREKKCFELCCFLLGKYKLTPNIAVKIMDKLFKYQLYDDETDNDIKDLIRRKIETAAATVGARS